MKKNVFCCSTAALLALGMAVPAMAADVTATPNQASVSVDGKAIAIAAYNIDGYNYFKLRDVAAALNGTAANFEVGFDAETKSIALTKNAAYTATGQELKDAATEKKTAAASGQKILLDGAEVSMQAYLIDGYNYFQLRELGKTLGFEVAWDNEAKAINMITVKADDTEAPAEDNKDAETPAEDNKDAETPAEDNKDAETPAEDNKDAEAPAEDSKDAAADNKDAEKTDAEDNKDAAADNKDAEKTDAEDNKDAAADNKDAEKTDAENADADVAPEK